jgi:pilus assembly protein CpaE
LLDVDLQGGSVATLLNIQSRQSLAKLGEVPIEDTTSLREEVISRISNHESGLRVLAAPSVIHDGVSITAEMIANVIKILRERFDIIIVDTPKWVGDRLIATLDEADQILLVAEPEIPSLAKLRESLRLFSRFEFDQEKVELIFNRVDPESELQPEEASEALSRKAYFSIPRETDRLTEAANTGSPPCAEENPKGIFANSIIEMAEKIKVDLGFPPSAPAPKKRRFRLRRKAS